MDHNMAERPRGIGTLQALVLVILFLSCLLLGSRCLESDLKIALAYAATLSA